MSRAQRIYDVIAAGHICLDIIPAFPDTMVQDISVLLRPGKLVNVGPAAISTGGPVSNTGLAMKKLGLRVAFMAKVGDDDFGRLIRERLRREGSDSGISVAAGEASSYTVAIAPPGIDRIFLHNPGTNDTFGAEDVDYSVVAQAKIFHLGYPPLMRRLFANRGEELVEIFRRVHEAGAITSLDMSLPDPASESGRAPWLQILERLLPFVDLFLPSVSEAFYMMAPEEYLTEKGRAAGGDVVESLTAPTYSRLARQFLAMGTKVVMLKAAAHGTYLRTDRVGTLGDEELGLPRQPEEWSHREMWCPSFHVPRIASATGSGDSAIAGFLAAFVRGFDPVTTLKYANCLGYQNLHALDALSGIRSWEETTAQLTSGTLRMNELKVDEPGWEWEEELGVWVGPADRTRAKA
jgi:sugar/nucleoside kinase (ribokinase family)